MSRGDDGRADLTMVLALLCGLLLIVLVLMGLAHLIDYIQLHRTELGL